MRARARCDAKAHEGITARRSRDAGAAFARRAGYGRRDTSARDASARRVDLAFWIFSVKLRYFAYSGCIRGNRARVAAPDCGDILSWTQRDGERLTTNALAMSRRGVDGGGT